MEKKKNILIGVLVCVIAALCIIISFVLGTKFNNNEEIGENNINNENKQEVVSYVEEKDNIPYITFDGFDLQNNEIKNFYNATNASYKYAYHVANNILFINIEKSGLVTPLEGKVTYLNYYIDLNNNKILNANDVLNSLKVNMNDFNTYCESCNINSLDNEVYLVPVGSLLYVRPMGMGTFNSFFVNYNN